MNLGILLSAYALPKYVKQCLLPWSKYQIPIVCSSYNFCNFEKKDNSETLDELKSFTSDIFYDNEICLNESEARNLALEKLKEKNIDTILILDIDEFYSEKNIDTLLNFVNSDAFKYVAWSDIHFKNYTFKENQWIDGFCPPRLFKIKHLNLTLDKFYWDNDVVYTDHLGNSIDYKTLSKQTIPKNKLQVKHLSWLNDIRSKEKVEYQIKHFGSCSFNWNYNKNILEFNSEYFLKNKMPVPEVIYDLDNEI